jgi:hypothetical protein
MKVKSIGGWTTDDIKASLSDCISDGFTPTLAIVFASIKMDRGALCDLMQQAGIDVLGATSCGEFINGRHSEGAAVVLLLDLPREDYAILFEDIHGRDLAEVSTQMTGRALQLFEKPAFILCSTGVSVNGEMFAGDVLLRSMERALGPGVQIYGGMAGDDGTFTGSYVFTHGKETDLGMAALVLDENKISLHGMAISGWKPLGITRTVTKSEDGWLYEMDGQPALDMYLKYLGKEAIPGEDKYRLFE